MSISGGDDKDSIGNSGASVTVDGGADADFLYNDGNTVSVFGGAGNDVVSLASSSNRALNTTVNAGLGNDTVYGNSLASVNYKYVKGDGKDVIYGFNTVSTLFIAGSYWTTEQSGNDIIVNVSKGNVTLKDFAGLSPVNIKIDTIPGYWTVSGTTAIYNGYDNTVLTKVTNLKKGLVATDGKIDGIALDGVTVTLSERVLDPTSKEDVTINNDYKLALAGDVPEPEIKPTVWSVSGTTAKLQASKTAGYTLDDDDTRVKHADEETTVNATAIKGLAKGLIVKPDGTIDGIQLSGKTISLANKVLGDNVQIGKNYEFNFTTDCRGASISGTAGADTVNVEGTNMTISGGRGNDTVTLGGARNTFVYKNGDGDDVIVSYGSDK